ncbi:hypothetical protein AA0N74_03905, partial [Chromobacterium vaccinii]|uniref:hypothetical protein n=1 Tax=Chromobacterium vaccinii TaxID=1108595 RepID=UPI0031DB4B46
PDAPSAASEPLCKPSPAPVTTATIPPPHQKSVISNSLILGLRRKFSQKRKYFIRIRAGKFNIPKDQYLKNTDPQ